MSYGVGGTGCFTGKVDLRVKERCGGMLIQDGQLLASWISPSLFRVPTVLRPWKNVPISCRINGMLISLSLSSKAVMSLITWGGQSAPGAARKTRSGSAARTTRFERRVAAKISHRISARCTRSPRRTVSSSSSWSCWRERHWRLGSSAAPSPSLRRCRQRRLSHCSMLSVINHPIRSALWSSRPTGWSRQD